MTYSSKQTRLNDMHRKTIRVNAGIPDNAYEQVCDSGLCATVGGESWDLLERQGRAHFMCASCPVRTLCLREACVSESISKNRYWVRGGAYPQDRVRISRAYLQSRKMGQVAERQHRERLRRAVVEDTGRCYWLRQDTDYFWKSPIWGWGRAGAKAC